MQCIVVVLHSRKGYISKENPAVKESTATRHTLPDNCCMYAERSVQSKEWCQQQCAAGVAYHVAYQIMPSPSIPWCSICLRTPSAFPAAASAAVVEAVKTEHGRSRDSRHNYAHVSTHVPVCRSHCPHRNMVPASAHGEFKIAKGATAATSGQLKSWAEDRAPGIDSTTVLAGSFQQPLPAQLSRHQNNRVQHCVTCKSYHRLSNTKRKASPLCAITVQHRPSQVIQSNAALPVSEGKQTIARTVQAEHPSEMLKATRQCSCHGKVSNTTVCN